MPCSWAARVLADRLMQKLAVYILMSIFLAVQALAEPFNQEVYAGVAGPIECLVVESRATARVALLETLALDQREVHLINDEGRVKAAFVANCIFEGASYTCVWGKTKYLEIHLDEVFSSTVNRMQPKPFIRGWLKSDIFRPGSGVSCPVSIEPRT